MQRTTACVILAVAWMMLNAGVAVSQESEIYVRGEVLVGFRPSAAMEARDAAVASIGGHIKRRINPIHLLQLTFTDRTVPEAIEELLRNESVEYAEPNYYGELLFTPDDSLFDDSWHLQNTGQQNGTAGADIDAPGAWEFITTSPSVLIGVLDTGVDYTHPDLSGNMWTNTWEANGQNGVDDDANGFIDDVHGYDIFDDDGDPMDEHAGSHGTAVASVIAAEGNNSVGLAGITWSTQIVAIRVTDGYTITIGDIEYAIYYALTVGAKVTNNSYRHFGGYSQSLSNMINYACTGGQLFVAAAGNGGSDNDNDPDYLKTYPASYNPGCIISVGMSDRIDSLVTWTRPCSNNTASGYGATSVDLAAPGCEVCCAVRYNVNPSSPYTCGSSGTSLATPIVTGAVGLLWAQNPSWSNYDVKNRLLNTVDVLPSMENRMVSEGRLNLQRAVDNVAPDAVTDLTVESMGRWSAAVSWTAPGDDSTEGSAKSFDLRYSTSSITESNFAQATQVATGSPGTAGTQYCIEIDDLSSCTTYYFAMKTEDDAFNVSALSNVPSGTTACSGQSYATCPGEFMSAEPGSEQSEAPGIASTARATGGVAKPLYVLSLGPARPSPSRGKVTIGYSLAQQFPVSIRVYDVAGRLVRTLVSGTGEAGPHDIVWDARDDHGVRVAAGVYFYRMNAGSWQSQRKVVFLEQ
jgi:subtilisin family serine protease